MVLITGATGLLGSHICREMLQQGIAFQAMRRPGAGPGLLKPLEGSIQWVEAELEDTPVLDQLLQGIDTLVHCAAIVSFDRRDADAMERINVEATRDLVDLALKHRIRKLVFVSSVAALGRTTKDTTLDETAQWKESPLNTTYAYTKHRAELEIWRGHAEGLQVLVVNPSVVLGAGDPNKSSTRIWKYVWDENKYYTDGVINFIDARDAADCLVQLMQKDISGQRYILNAGSVPYKQLFEQMAHAMGKRAPYLRAKGWKLQLALLSEYLKSIFTGTPPKVTRETLRATNYKIHYQNHKVVNTLGYQFKPLNETLSHLADHWRQEGFGK
jgi:dihydroflavonol-4-reductase